MRTSAFVTWLGVGLLSAVSARAETLPVWWAPSLAGPQIEALEEVFEAPFPAPIQMQGPRGAKLSVTSCDEAADAVSRNFKAVTPAAQDRVMKCVATAHVLFAAEAGTSTFRLPVNQVTGRPVPGGAPKPLSTAHVETLPAMLAPFEGCGFGVLALRASDRFWSLLRFAHVYGAAQEDDGRDADTLNGKGNKALKVKETEAGLSLRQNGLAVQLSLLALADFDADGTEDALIQKTGGGDSGGLYMVSQFREGAVMNLKNLSTHYKSLLRRCPDLMLDMARTSQENAEASE